MSQLECRILGPVEIRLAGAPARIGGTKTRGLLAALAAKPGQIVGIDRLIDALWAAEPPRTAVENTRNYVRALRMVLGDHADRLVTELGGYALHLDVETSDVLAFERLTATGRAQAERAEAESAAASLSKAVSLWRGRAAEGVPRYGPLGGWLAKLDQIGAAAQQSLAETLLQVGDAAGAASELLRIIAVDSANECAWELLITAYYQAGDIAAASRCFTTARNAIAAGTGLVPGPRLATLQRRILDRDPTLDRPRATTRLRAVAVGSGVRGLPSASGQLLHREREVDTLTTQLRATHALGAAGHPVVIVHGPVGVGTSALAIEAARDVAPDFPDGLLYADARAADGEALPAEDLARRLVEGADRSRGVETPATVREVTAERRMLIVIDNVATLEQIREILPADGSCRTLITSRRPLGALDNAYRFSVAPLAHRQAVDVMRAMLVSRPALPDRHLDLLVHACHASPLALRIAAAVLTNRPHLGLPELAHRLSTPDMFLAILHADDLCYADRLRDIVSRLSTEAMGVLVAWPGPTRSASIEAVALATGAAPHRVHEWLEELAEWQLVRPDREGTFIREPVADYVVELAAPTYIDILTSV